jgi:ABC-type microcin C transport system permease subunit YejB
MPNPAKILGALLLSILTCSALAHHSFAVFEFATQIPFDGTVESINFRNPHISMTLKTTDEEGNEMLVEFIEGAPANMLVRSGLKPDMIKPGTHIIATGSPLIEDRSKFFLRVIKLDSGEEF